MGGAFSQHCSIAVSDEVCIYCLSVLVKPVLQLCWEGGKWLPPKSKILRPFCHLLCCCGQTLDYNLAFVLKHLTRS